MKTPNHPKFHASLVTILVILSFLVSPLPAGARSSPAGHSDHLDSSALSMPVAQITPVQMDPDWGGMPLYFIANQGQVEGDAAYYVQGSDKTLFFNPQGVTFALVSSLSTMQKDKGPRRDAGPSGRWTVKLDFVDANSVQPLGQSPTGAVISYFKGSPGDWHTGLPTYSSIIYPDLWAGIDLVYAGTADRLKQEIIVAPGADPGQIRLAYRGATVRLNKAGQLDVRTPAGGFLDEAPMAYQVVNGQRLPVSVEYALDDANPSGGEKLYSYGFRVGAYDPALPLVIDPEILVYCGYIGGSDSDSGSGIALDPGGNAYVTGETLSTQATFPEMVGPDLTFNGVTDAFVAKVKADGTGLVYAGYIGGSSYDYGTGIAVDADGNAYISGVTTSTEATFPATTGPDLTYNSPHGDRDAFVAKLNPDGTGLVYAGYIGGPGHDDAEAIAVDSSGNAYVTGDTGTIIGHSDTFPAIVGPSLSRIGAFDVYVAKVKADGTGLLYSGFIGSGGDMGYGVDDGTGIAVDSAGSAYVTGYTTSGDPAFPVLVGPDLTFNGGLWDAFITKVKADGSGLEYSGFIGGNEDDYATGIAVDSHGNAYVTGYTVSPGPSFPLVAGPDLTFNGGYWDVFVTKVKADGTGYVYSGYIGGDGTDVGYGIAVDTADNAYVTGYTGSTAATFPEVLGPDLTLDGYDDAFVAKVKADGTRLVYAGYIGGDGGEGGNGIAVDPGGDAYVTGDTSSTQVTFPEQGGPDLTFNGGSEDAFVAKVSFRASQNKTFNSVGSQDGWILESTETSTVGGTLNAIATTFRLGDDAVKKQYRGILSFNTGPGLPDTAVITRVTLKFKKQGITGGGNPVTTFQGFMLDIKKGFFGIAALQASDFQTAASKSYGPFLPTPVGSSYSINLTSGKAYINKLSTLSGLTQIRLRFKLDDNNNTVANYLSLFSGNADAASRPQLIIEYYIP